jgi:phosphatidylserine/phosphatidylglycerophosphate/cardiolipin synthase-like enzyme
MDDLPRADEATVAAFMAAIHAPEPEADAEPGITALVNRQCELEDYEEITVPSFDVDGEMVAYASPEATFALTKAFLQAASASIVIGIYDFTSGPLKNFLLQAMQRGVKVTLMLDLDGRAGETPLFEELKTFGCEAVPAPSCASEHARYFSSSHEKVIVIDDTWTLVQSGNYSDNSIPANERDGGDPAHFVPGNRDMGLAVQSPALAAFARNLLQADIQLELDGAGGIVALNELARAEPITLLQAAPEAPPPLLFPSKRFAPSTPIRVTPVLSPDNYMLLVPDLLAAAKRSIVIEQQYIRGHQTTIQRLLSAVREAMDRTPGLEVRIILGLPFPGEDYERDVQRIRDLGPNFGLVLGTHVKLINPGFFVHCHNKLIVVDEETLLVGSQNWSTTAVTSNREMSLLVPYPDLAKHYQTIFDLDWETGLDDFPTPDTAFFAPAALPAGGLVRLDLGDYIEV